MLSASSLSTSGPDLQLTPIQQNEFLEVVSLSRDTAHLRQGLSSLTFVSARGDSDSTTVLFQQSYDGLPIHDAFVAVTQNSHGDFEVFDRGYEQVNANRDLTTEISASAAQTIAFEDFGNHNLVADSQLTWFQSGSEMKLTWKISTFDSTATSGFHTLVDANSGAILSQSNQDFAEVLLSNPSLETGVYPRIVINDGIGAAGSRAYAASGEFDAVVQIGSCSGVLIAPNVILSARHCGSASGTQVRFGDNRNSPDFTANVSSRFLPAGNGVLLDGGDVEILTLNQNVPASVATPMRLIDATDDLEGMVAATVGYGFNGVGSSGHGGSADGFRWGGENIIDVYGSPPGSSGSNIISTDFDNGTFSANTIPGSAQTPLEFEATTAPGDSGSPVMVQVGSEWVIAGVLSGGTTNTSVYGDISWWTGTAVFRTDIESFGGSFVAQEAGSVAFDAAEYTDTQPVSITVADANGINPLQVTVTSDSGDSETVTLTDNGDTTFTATISADPGSVIANDGTLQVQAGDTITVTYNDPDDGMGQAITAMDTAIIVPPPQSTIDLDSATYDEGDTIGIEAFDVNGVNPLTVTVTASSGDSESVILTDNGDATYSSSIGTGGGVANANDGTLQVVAGDTVTVTYNDPNNGQGGTSVATDTAIIVAHSQHLVGIDFGDDPTPNNWTSIGGGTTQTYSDLIDETGALTAVDLTITGTWSNLGATANANTIPSYANSLAEIDGQIYTNSNPITLEYSDLTPLADYQLYVFGLESFFSTIRQRISVQGDGAAVSYDQIFGRNELAVNDQVGDSSVDLTDYALIVTADESGTITVDVDPLTGTGDVSLAGIAIVPISSTVPDGDFNDDGSWNVFDLDALAAEIIAGTNNPAFDLTQDGTLSNADRDAWLAEAGGINLGAGRAYLLGDANLDSAVDGTDFITWNANRFSSGGLWSGGDFNIDGFTDGSDFIIWNQNRFTNAINRFGDGEEDDDDDEKATRLRRFDELTVDAIWSAKFQDSDKFKEI